MMLILEGQFIFLNKKQMKNYIIIVIFSTILFSGCEGILFPKSKYRNLPDLGNGYKFSTGDGNSLAITDSNNTIIIEMEILNYAFDSTFIIASQRPWDIPDVDGIKEMTYKQRNKAFEKSKFQQYWIINKEEKCENIGIIGSGNNRRAIYSNVYGPYTKEEFQQKREELGVPKKLQLKE